jgi:hypothetical protein
LGHCFDYERYWIVIHRTSVLFGFEWWEMGQSLIWLIKDGEVICLI